MDLMILKFWLAYFSVLGSQAFPDGPPSDTCIGMIPHHGGMNPRLEIGRYVITVNVTSYLPNDVIEVEVSSPTGHNISGVQVMAMRVSSNGEEQLGTFSDLSPPGKLRYMNCSGILKNMVSHQNPDHVDSVSMKWTIDENAGPILFISTVVAQFNEIYYNIRSDIIHPSSGAGPIVPPLHPLSPISPTMDPIKWEECEDDKGCLLYPGYCKHDEYCKVAVSYKVNVVEDVPSTVTFEIMAKTDGYVSIGFSDDKTMGADQTVTCTAYYDRATIQNGFNHPGKWNVRTSGTNLTNLALSYVDGKLTCRFTRPISMVVEIEDVPDPVTFDLNTDYYLFVAWGSLYHLTDGIEYHKERPVISDDKIDFSESGYFRGSVMTDFVRAHAAMMSLAWMGFAGLVVVMPRYYKNGFGGREFCGAKVWFQIHRVAATLTFLLTVAGLTMILIEKDGEIVDDDSAQNHMIMGFTVVSVVCAQLLMGLLRPGPHGKLRPYFNVFHKLLGYSGLTIAAATMVYAFMMDQFTYEMQKFGESVIALWAGCLVFFELLMMGWQYVAPKFPMLSRKRARSDEFSLDKMPEETADEEHKKNPSHVILAFFFMFCAASATAALCITLFF